MKLRELREWMSELPHEFDEYDVVNSEKYVVEEYDVRLDKPVIELFIDENSKEACIVNSPDKDRIDRINSNNNKRLGLL